MKTNYRFRRWAAVSWGALSLIFACRISGQTLVNLGTQGRNIDFSNAAETRPARVGSSLPSACSTGDLFFNTSGVAGQNLFGCASPNIWALIGQNSTSLADPGANGILKRTAANITTAVAAPTGALVGTTDTQILTNKSIDASEINSGILSVARLPALTGDVTTIAGSTAASLSTVNYTPGSFGDATHSVQMTVDAKGRVTTINQVPITNSGSAASYYQQVKFAGAALTPRPAVNFSSAFTAVDNSAASQTNLDLATVNTTPGTFGSATQVPVITVNGYGQITAISTTPVTSTGNSGASGSSGSSSSSAISAGILSSIPSTCSSGALYVATDQPTGQQIYTCSSSNNWTQFISLGGSGSLAFTNGSLDIVTSVIPRLTAANNFTGLNTFSNGILLASSATQPACSQNTRGLFWFLNNGASKDGIQVCVYTGSVYNWISLY